MDHNSFTIFADAEGIWGRYPGGEMRLRVSWDEIVAVGGACYDAGDRVLTCVEFDLVWGEVWEVFTDWPGFGALADATLAHLPGLPADWLSRITALTPGSGTEVWRLKARG